jgi:hypothetical protein
MELSMKDITRMARKKGRAFSNGLMAQFLKEILGIITSKDMVNISGMTEGTMKENGLRTKCMAEVYFSGLMEECIMEII